MVSLDESISPEIENIAFNISGKSDQIVEAIVFTISSKTFMNQLYVIHILINILARFCNYFIYGSLSKEIVTSFGSFQST